MKSKIIPLSLKTPIIPIKIPSNVEFFNSHYVKQENMRKRTHHSSIDEDRLIAGVADMDPWGQDLLANEVDRMVPGQAKHGGRRSSVQRGEGWSLKR